MVAITASMVAELRAKTDAPMMECKKALTEAEGDMVKAEELLRVKLGSKAGKAAARVTAEGVVAIVTAAASSASATQPPAWAGWGAATTVGSAGVLMDTGISGNTSAVRVPASVAASAGGACVNGASCSATGLVAGAVCRARCASGERCSAWARRSRAPALAAPWPGSRSPGATPRAFIATWMSVNCWRILSMLDAVNAAGLRDHRAADAECRIPNLISVVFDPTVGGIDLTQGNL